MSPRRLSPPRRTEVAKPPPVPSSGFLPLSTVLAAFAARTDPCEVRRFAVTPRRFAAFFHAARVPWSRPPELSLPGEPYPLSRATCFLAGSPPIAAGAATTGASRPLSPNLPALCHTRPPGGGPGTHEPGRWIPAIASPAASTHRSVPHVPSPSHSRWAHRLTTGTPASKPCSPRESVPRRPRYLARPGPPVGALLGFFSPSRALSITVRGSVSRRDTRRGRSPEPRAPLGAQPSRLHAATRTPTPGLASPGSADTRGL